MLILRGWKLRFTVQHNSEYNVYIRILDGIYYFIVNPFSLEYFFQNWCYFEKLRGDNGFETFRLFYNLCNVGDYLL